MPIHRLLLVAAAMGGAAVALSVLAPGAGAAVQVLGDPQRTLDAAGPEALLVSLVGLLAWGVWAWGALGLLLTAAAAVPGALGGAATVLLRVVLPAAARHGAAVALGAGLAAPVLLGSVPPVDRPVVVAGASSLTVPDWPRQSGAGVPDWPAAPATGQNTGQNTGRPTTQTTAQTMAPHVVVPGDRLWDIAENRLVGDGLAASDAEVAAAVQQWWSANHSVIGADPDLILPGQVLHPPPPP